MNTRPAAPNTSMDRCWAAPCRAVAPPRHSASMVERMLWRHVSARDCTRCILKEWRRGRSISYSSKTLHTRLNHCERLFLPKVTLSIWHKYLQTNFHEAVKLKKNQKWDDYFFVRLLQEGFWWHSSMASFLGNSVFLRTLNQTKKYICS